MSFTFDEFVEILPKIKSMMTKQANKKRDKSLSYIDKSTKRSDLEKFSLHELVEWTKENDVDIKKIKNKYKKELTKVIWDTFLNTEWDSGSDSDSSSCSDDEE